MSKNLIVYFSHKGENYFSGKIVDVPKGNTAYVAEFIRDAVGGDLFETVPDIEYSSVYKECTKAAAEEFYGNERPAVKRKLGDISDYTDVFVCGPCWCGTWPMCMFTLLEGLDWKGKRVYPVMTHEGSGFGNALGDMGKLCPGADVREGLTVVGGEAKDSRETVSDWARKALSL